jgi:hypothetical protein
MKLLVIFLFLFNAYAYEHEHKDFQKLLDKYVKVENKQSLVNYNEIKKDPLLDKYLEKLSAVKESEYNKWTKDQQLAFLINAYNAFTIKLINNHYPLKSIKDIGSFFSGPWSKSFFTLLDRKRTLDWVEHKKIRKDFSEPRIHFAVVCASISCPNLQKTVYTEKNLEELLEKGAKFFLSDKNKNYVKDNKLYLSKIFKWYSGDFKDVKNFAIKRMNLKEEIKEIKYLSYDWSLNEWN